MHSRWTRFILLLVSYKAVDLKEPRLKSLLLNHEKTSLYPVSEQTWFSRTCLYIQGSLLHHSHRRPGLRPTPTLTPPLPFFKSPVSIQRFVLKKSNQQKQICEFRYLHSKTLPSLEQLSLQKGVTKSISDHQNITLTHFKRKIKYAKSAHVVMNFTIHREQCKQNTHKRDTFSP